MSKSRLTGLLAGTLRRERERRRLTQEKLASLAKVSQATIARVERGAQGASPPMIDRIFAALGLQLTIGVEALDADLDAAIDRLIEKPPGDRAADAGFDEVLDSLPVPYVLTGATAALAQGAPVPVDDIEIALRWVDADAFDDWLTARYGQRWHARWECFGYLATHPREPGDHRWRTMHGVVRVRMCDELPASIEVRVGDRARPAVPLADLQVDDPRLRALLQRYGERREPLPHSATGPRAGG